MNYTQSFEEFSRSVKPTDLALYAGFGIVIWVLFKDKLSPVQKIVMDFINSLKKSTKTVSNVTSIPKDVVPVFNPVNVPVVVSKDKEDVFFKLVVSWKQTRDLAVESGCDEAVKVADQMFPYLSPNVCEKKDNHNEF
jgi:hypothetical protein